MSENARTVQHPGIEQIAALLDGRLGGDERALIVAHLADCEECYEIFAESVRFLREGDRAGEAPAEVPAPPVAIDEAGRILRPAPARWRRAALVTATVAAAAAAVALVIWNPAATFGFGAKPPTLAELAVSLPAEGAAPAVEDTWEHHGWPVMRGTGPALGPEEERAFQIGVRVVEMDVALAAGDAELATHITHDLETRLAAIDLADPLRILYAGDQGIRGRLAAGEAPGELLVLNRQGDEILAPDEDDDYPGFVDGFWYGLGKWAAAAHLAAAGGDPDFFEERRNRRYFQRAAERELPAEVAGPVRRLDELLGRDRAARLPEIRRELESLIRLAGGGEPAAT
jgi:hypothetical protein